MSGKSLQPFQNVEKVQSLVVQRTLEVHDPLFVPRSPGCPQKARQRQAYPSPFHEHKTATKAVLLDSHVVVLGATYRTRKGSMGILACNHDCIISMFEPLLMTSAMTLAFEVFALHLLHSYWSYTSSGVAPLEVCKSHSGRGTNQTTSPHKIEDL